MKIEIDAPGSEYLSYLVQPETPVISVPIRPNTPGFRPGTIQLPKLIQVFRPDRTRNLQRQNVFFAIQTYNFLGQPEVVKCHIGQAKYGTDKFGRKGTYKITCPKKTAASNVNEKRKYCPFHCLLRVLKTNDRNNVHDFYSVENWEVLGNPDALNHTCAPTVDCFAEVQRPDGRTHFDSLSLDKCFGESLQSLEKRNFPFSSDYPEGSIFFPKFVKIYDPIPSQSLKYQNFYVALETDNHRGKVVKKCILRTLPGLTGRGEHYSDPEAMLLHNPRLGIHKLICSVTKPYCPFFCIIRAVLTMNPKDKRYFTSENWAVLENTRAQNHVCPDNKGVAD